VFEIEMTEKQRSRLILGQYSGTGVKLQAKKTKHFNQDRKCAGQIPSGYIDYHFVNFYCLNQPFRWM
jgi:hypothetical protein